MGFGPFENLFTGQIRAAIRQPVLADTPELGVGTVTLRYRVNTTGLLTASEINLLMVGLQLLTPAKQALLGVTLTLQETSIVAGQAVLTMEINTSSATFATRFPSVG